MYEGSSRFCATSFANLRQATSRRLKKAAHKTILGHQFFFNPQPHAPSSGESRGKDNMT